VRLIDLAYCPVVVVGRLHGALQHVGSWEAFLRAQEGEAQRGHVRRSARSVLPFGYFVPNATGRCSVACNKLDF
jgi:hypothetical protein